MDRFKKTIVALARVAFTHMKVSMQQTVRLLWGGLLWGMLVVAWGRELPPNIILIMADDLGYECLGSSGSATYETPRLDLLAEEGVRFRHAHSQPLCTPSRVQIMTGKYNVRNYKRFGLLSYGERTFGNMLQEAGYVTGIAGKWQLGEDRNSLAGFGFDEYFLWQLEKKEDRYLDSGEMIENGRVLPGGVGQYGPDRVSDFALGFVERHKNRPFFLYYPMILPHSPFMATPHSESVEGLSRAEAFQDMVEYMDFLVGRLVDKVESLGLRKSTMILFTGDNGTHQSIFSEMEDGRVIQGGKGTPLDRGTHVPLIASWPGSIRMGMTSDALVDFSDFFPTLAEVAQIDLRESETLDGFSFLPVLRDELPATRGWIYCWYDQLKVGQASPLYEFARDRTYKLYRDGRLYHLPSDPDEESPLNVDHLDEAARSAHAALTGVLAYYEHARPEL